MLGMVGKFIIAGACIVTIVAVVGAILISTAIPALAGAFFGVLCFISCVLFIVGMVIVAVTSMSFLEKKK